MHLHGMRRRALTHPHSAFRQCHAAAPRHAASNPRELRHRRHLHGGGKAGVESVSPCQQLRNAPVSRPLPPAVDPRDLAVEAMAPLPAVLAAASVIAAADLFFMAITCAVSSDG